MQRFRYYIDNLPILSREVGTGILTGNLFEAASARGSTKQETANSVGVKGGAG